MGLYVVTGTMGGGKSYFAAELAYTCWSQGGIVHSYNLDWNVEKLQELGFWERHIQMPLDISKWVRKEEDPEGGERMASDIIVGGTEGSENLIIIDEAGLALNSMDQAENKKRNRMLFDLVTMSRQIGVDMYFICQASTSLDVFIRNIAEATIHLKDMERVPGFGFFFGIFLGKFQRSYLSPQTKKAIRATYARFNPLIGSLYHTHRRGARINIKRSDGRTKKSRGNLSIRHSLLILSLLLGVCFSLWKVYRFAYPPAGQLSELDPKYHLNKSRAPGAASVASAAAKKEDAPAVPHVIARSLDNTFVADDQGRTFSTHGHGTRARGFVPQGDSLTVFLLDGRQITLKLYD